MSTLTLEVDSLLGSSIAVTSADQFCGYVLQLARQHAPSYVCFATAHMVVEATRKQSIHSAYSHASVISPDGQPVAWFLRLLGHPDATCVSGPRTFPLLLRQAEQDSVRVGFYGGRPETLARIQQKLSLEYPNLQVAYCFSPPFRNLTDDEQEQHLAAIRDSGVDMLFVGLGSPRQECWMDDHSPKLPCVCLGVGAAFEFYSGEKVLPPLWVQKLGLTWLVRLCQEPRRLMRRNLYSPYFLLLAARWILMDKPRRILWAQHLGMTNAVAQSTHSEG